MQCAESLRVQAAFDGELDPVSAAAVERHAEHCPECRALREHLEHTRSALRRDLDYGQASPELRARVARMLQRDPELAEVFGTLGQAATVLQQLANTAQALVNAGLSARNGPAAY